MQVAPKLRRDLQMLHGRKEWMLATARKPLRRLRFHDSVPSIKPLAGRKNKDRGQLEPIRLQSAVVFVVVLALLLWTAWLIVDILQQVVG